MMASRCQLSLIFVIMQGCSVVLGRAANYAEECVVWENVTRQLEREQNVQMVCVRNQMCTGIDCTGTYSYNGLYTFFQEFTMDFCFGMAILPCTIPTLVHFHVDIPDQEQDHFSTTVSHSEAVRIPGAHYDIGGGVGKVDAFVVVDMNRTFVNDKPYLELGIKLKVRGQGPVEGLETFIKPLERTLMPDSLIPVPLCNTKVANTTKDPACHQLSTVIPSPTTPYAGKPTKPAPTQAACKTNYARDCPHNEMCVAARSSSKKQTSLSTGSKTTGTCQCINGFIRGSDNICHPMPTTTIPEYKDGTVPTVANHHQHLYTIVGCVLGVVAVIGAILAVAIIQYKKYHARYGQHSALINNEEEDDDDDPLDIAT